MAIDNVQNANTSKLADSSAGRLPQALSADPFLRKNQIWFQRILPPSMERIQKLNKKNPHHLDQIVKHALNPSYIEPKQLAPSNYHRQIRTLQEKLYALGNQSPQMQQISKLLQAEINLTNDFNDQRLGAVPC